MRKVSLDVWIQLIGMLSQVNLNKILPVTKFDISVIVNKK